MFGIVAGTVSGGCRSPAWLGRDINGIVLSEYEDTAVLSCLGCCLPLRVANCPVPRPAVFWAFGYTRLSRTLFRFLASLEGSRVTGDVREVTREDVTSRLTFGSLINILGCGSTLVSPVSMALPALLEVMPVS